MTNGVASLSSSVISPPRPTAALLRVRARASMSLNPIPSSLGSSVASKSTNANLGGGGGEGSLYHHPNEQSRALCSSWISRLHLQPLPLPTTEPPPSPPLQMLPIVRHFDSPAAAAGDGDCGGVVSNNDNNNNNNNKHTISTDESRSPTPISNFDSSTVVRRCINLFKRRPSGGLTPRIAHWDGCGESVSGFSPFQVRSRSRALPQEDQGSLGRDVDDGVRVLGSGEYGGECFPLFRRMARLGQALCGERGMLGSCAGRVPFVRNHVKLSPYFQFRPSVNSPYPVDRNKESIGLPVSEGSTKIQEHRDQMRSTVHEDWSSAMPLSCFKSQDLVDDLPPSWRPYEQPVSADPWHGTASVQRLTTSRDAASHDGGAAAGVSPQTFCDLHFSHQNSSLNNLGVTPPVHLNEPREPFSFWNLGKFNKRTTTSASPLIELTSNLNMKRSANFDNFLPSKFRKLSNED